MNRNVTMTLILALTVLASAQANPGSLSIEAKEIRKQKPALRTMPGSRAALAADGRRVVYVRDGAVYSAPLGGKPTKLAEAGYYFLTPDGQQVVVPGGPFRKVPVGGGKVIPLAANHKAGRSSSARVSNKHLAFLNAAGNLVMVDLKTGKSLIVDLPPPEDKRCHAGSGVPRSFSPDGKWLTVQHGCDDEYLVSTSGAQKKLPFISAMFAEGLVFGSPKVEGKMRPKVVVLDPETDKSWTIDNVDYSPSRLVVPGKLAFIQVSGGSLQYVDLRSKKIRVLDEAGVTGFISTTADGQNALYSIHGKGECSVHALNFASGKRQRLAKVANGEQCFVSALREDKAIGYFWRAGGRESIVARIDTKSGKVRQLGPVTTLVGSLRTAGDSFIISGRDSIAFE